jgi:hypothetical protein
MKKLLLSLSFMALVFANIKAADNNEITTCELMEFTRNYELALNAQLTLQGMSDKQSVQGKGLFDFSIKEVWNNKFLPIVKSKGFKKFCSLVFATISLIAIFDMAIAFTRYMSYCSRVDSYLGALLNITIKDGVHEAIFEKSFMPSCSIAVASTILMMFSSLTL